MSRVSDMVKMYSQSNLKPAGDKPVGGVARKWPPVATGGTGLNKPPPTAPKPKPALNGSSTLGRPSTGPKPFGNNETITIETKPAWQQELQRRRSNARDEQPSRVTVSKDRKDNGDENIPAWKIELNRAKAEKSKLEKKEEVSKPTWAKPKPEQNPTPNGPGFHLPKKPPPKPDFSAKPSSLWGAKPGLPSADDENSDAAPRRATPQNKSFSYNTMPKPTVEKSSGSFSGNSPLASRKYSEPATPASPKNRSSFLHTRTPAPPPTSDKPYKARLPQQNDLPPPPSLGDKPQKPNGVPRRLRVPKERYSEPPPLKPAKPNHVILPSRGKKKSSPLPPPPSSSRPLPSPTSRGLPLPPSLGARETPSSGPSLPARSKELSPPELPARPASSPIPGNKFTMPLPPPPTEIDDIYDDTADDPPPPPPTSGIPTLKKRESSGMIPTWDDEGEDIEAIYDETPDEPPAKPVIPAGFPTPGNIPQIPTDAGEDMYEDVEEYMRLKKLQEKTKTDGSVNSNESKEKKDKKKKDSEKKEKDVRKKFKLPLEGEIGREGHAVVNENCRGWGKNLAVSAGETVDVIRMTDNPKGKWLVRNAQGEYGYVDSDKVTINIADLRSTFGVGSKAPSGIGGGPAVPPPIIPTTEQEEDDVIYDETADDSIYQEL